MESNLWVELGEKNCSFAVGNLNESQLEYIDLTGGFGTRQVPFEIAYIEDEEVVLCGEEAKKFGNSVWAGENVQLTCDFLLTLIEKIEQQFHDYIFSSVVLINAAHSKESTCELIGKILQKEKKVRVRWVSIHEAFVAYGYSNQINEGTFIYFNDNWMDSHQFSLKNIQEESVMDTRMDYVSLSEIDDFYLDRIYKKYKEVYGKSIDPILIKREYEEQKLLVYRQEQTQDDVRLYTSIQYPPKKITLSYDAYEKFYQEWIQKNITFFNGFKGNIWVSGGYNQEPYWKCLFQTVKYHYDEHLLINGAKAFLKYQEKNNQKLCTSTKCHWGYMIIDQENRKIPFIIPGEVYHPCYQIRLVLTEHENHIPIIFITEDRQERHVFSVYFKPVESVTVIDIMLKISIDGQIKEVQYEC
jgi:hypothetical protein